jgi:hypothetical protein
VAMVIDDYLKTKREREREREREKERLRLCVGAWSTATISLIFNIKNLL